MKKNNLCKNVTMYSLYTNIPMNNDYIFFLPSNKLYLSNINQNVSYLKICNVLHFFIRKYSNLRTSTKDF